MTEFAKYYEDLLPEGAIVTGGVRVVHYVDPEGEGVVSWYHDGTHTAYEVMGMLQYAMMTLFHQHMQHHGFHDADFGE